MKYLKQFCIILAFCFIGEALHHFLPLPIPASIYGIVLLFLSLLSGLIRVEQIKETSAFLIEIMAVMFIPAAAGLINVWDVIKEKWFAYILVIVLSTVLVMVISGSITQRIIKGGKKS